MDVWLKRPDGSNAVGAVWPGATLFIDYSRESGKVFWTYALKRYKEEVGIDFDGVWLDMNEPSSWVEGDGERGCANNSINFPPYVPAGKRLNKINA